MNEVLGAELVLAGALVAGYLVGSINAAVFVSRALGKGDPREHGSGNAGASNIARQLGLGWAALVLGLDLGRGALVARVAWGLPEPDGAALLFGLFVGNRWPLAHGFRGGKGVATFIGVSAALAPPVWIAAALAAWVLVHRLTRRAWVGSLALVPIATFGVLWSLPPNAPAGLSAATAGAAVFVALAHLRNLRAERSAAAPPPR